MKAAKNMDSVFANCTDSELDFEVMFDDDDSLIDLVAGVNEAGELVTGPNPEDTYEYQLDEDGNDPIADPCDNGRREGTIKTNAAPEGSTKNPDEKFESPEGMKNEIPGSATSAEAKSHDDDEKDAEDKALTKEASDVCSKCGKPIAECSCGVKKAVFEAIINKALNEEDDSDMNDHDNADNKNDMNNQNQNNAAEKEMENDSKDSDIKEALVARLIEADVESRTDDTFESQLRAEGDKEDPISDKDDEDLRDGKEKYDSNQVEAIKQKIIGAAQEAAGCEDGECGIAKEADKDETVSDNIQTNSSANNIPPDAETQSSDGLAPATEAVKAIRNRIIENTLNESNPDVDETTPEDVVKQTIKSRIVEAYEDDHTVVYKGWTTNVHEAKSPEAMVSEEDPDDDADIEAVANGKAAADGELDLSVDYDDDELIDMALSGKI